MPVLLAGAGWLVQAIQGGAFKGYTCKWSLADKRHSGSG